MPVLLVKPVNRFYGWSPLADPEDEPVMTQCRRCDQFTDAAIWRKHRGDCPKCGAYNSSVPNED